jgi:pimeloyl-ACP methyl ester carboxylesterase
MTSPPPSPWETAPIHSSLVPIGTHSLYLSISGPPRQPGSPLIIVFPGAAETSSAWPAVSRRISAFARILLYDRTGLGRSEDGPPPTPRTTETDGLAVTAAKELHSALSAAQISSPYVLVAHSYGGIIAREFLHLYTDEVAGMVLADTTAETQHHYFSPSFRSMASVMGTLPFARITGLHADSQLTTEEWRARAAEQPRNSAAAQAEAAGFVEVCETLGKKRQSETQALGMRPLVVIRCNSERDYRRMYEAGVKAGNGSEEEREGFGKLLERWDRVDWELKRGLLGLSGRARWVEERDCGHNVNITRPDIIAESVRWVLADLADNSEGKGSPGPKKRKAAL